MVVGTALIDPYKIFDKIALKPGMRVADLGCGRTGHFVFPLSKLVGDTGVVYAVDIIKEVLENVKSQMRSEGCGNVQIIWSDLETVGKTPIPENSLDACFYVNAMFLMRKKLEAIKEAARFLAPAGYLVITDWLKKIGPLGPDQSALVNREQVINFAKECGLALVENYNLSEHHFCLIFKKS